MDPDGGGQCCPTWAPLLPVMSPERQLGRSNQLLSCPGPNPPSPNPTPRWAESLGLDILSGQMWIWVLILFFLHHPPTRSKSFKSFFLLPEEGKHMGLSGRGFSAPSCCSQAPEAPPQPQISFHLSQSMGSPAVAPRLGQGLSLGGNKALLWEKAD